MRATDNTSSHLNRVTTKTEPEGGKEEDEATLPLSIPPSLPTATTTTRLSGSKWTGARELSWEDSLGAGGGKLESREFRSARMIFSPSVEFWFC